MATATDENDGATVTITETEQAARPHSPTLILPLHRPPDAGPRVRWTEGTVDNEFMNKKKSKCCCVYTKPHDPQSNDDQPAEADEYDNCEHCRFHTQSDFAAKPDDRQPKVKIVVGKPKSPSQ